MNKRLLLALCLTVMTAALFAFTSRSQSKGGYVRVGTAGLQQTAEIPQHVIYSHLFHQLASFKKQAEEAESKGKDGRPLRSLFKREAELNDVQAFALDVIASECLREVAMQDAKAKVAIDAFKSRFPNGRMPPGQTPPPPPSELTVMQEQRNAIILRARERLQLKLGEQEFSQFEAFVNRRVASNISSVGR